MSRLFYGRDAKDIEDLKAIIRVSPEIKLEARLVGGSGDWLDYGPNYWLEGEEKRFYRFDWDVHLRIVEGQSHEPRV